MFYSFEYLEIYVNEGIIFRNSLEFSSKYINMHIVQKFSSGFHYKVRTFLNQSIRAYCKICHLYIILRNLVFGENLGWVWPTL